MPTYEYRCKDCGEHLEVVQSFTDDALTVCPACQGDLRKVFGSIGISFKGSGFYKTDSRPGASTSSSSGGDSSSSDNGSSSDKGDKKADTKTDGAKADKKAKTDSTSTSSSSTAKTA
jgi:putative FmdB family regulatory protein